MKITIDRRKYDTLMIAVQEAIDDGDKSPLCESVIDCFTDDQVEEVEDSLGEELFDFIEELIDDWSSDDGESLWDLISQKLEEQGITLFIGKSLDIEEDDDEDEDEIDESEDEIENEDEKEEDEEENTDD